MDEEKRREGEEKGGEEEEGERGRGGWHGEKEGGVGRGAFLI